MHPILTQISEIGLVPVIKITEIETAVPLARALLKGGIPCAEITFRTELAPEAMRRILESVPELLLGAGTVTTCAQVDSALASGARFIVSPGLNPEIVRYCQRLDVPIIPGICTPSEIEQAMSLGLQEVKFFPAENCGGVRTIRAISAAYPNIRFMPTGGINPGNINEYLAFPKIIACGGSWLTPADAIAAGDYEKITALSAEAVKTILGCKLAHIGINAESSEEAERTAKLFCALLGLEYLPGERGVFAGEMVEVMRGCGRGKYGHIGIQVNDLRRAVAYFTRLGHPLDPPRADTGVAFFQEEIAGFAVHLMQKT